MRAKPTAEYIKYYLVSLPIAFAIFFFGLMPVKYDAVLHADNIEGEGICTTCACNPTAFSPFYQTSFYFGSELRKATIVGNLYNTDYILMDVSNVSQFDITGIDAYVWNIHVSHYDGGKIMTSTDRFETDQGVLTNTGEALHVDVSDPDEGISFNIHKQMIPAAFWVIYFSVVAFAAFLLALLVNALSGRWAFLSRILSGMSGIIVAILAGQFFCGSLPFVDFTCFVLNFMLLYALSLAVGAITLPWIGTVATMGFTAFWYIANYFVIALRGKPIMPADLKAAGTAAEVMGGYVFRPTWQMVVGVMIVILYAVGIVLIWRRQKRPAALSADQAGVSDVPADNTAETDKENGLKPDKNRWILKKQLVYRLSAVVAAVIICIISINTSAFKNLDSFAWDAVLQKSFHEEGIALTFLKSAMNSRVEEPEGYSSEKVGEYLAEYQNQSQETSGVQPTNIIMVMNEAFSDLRTVGLDESVDVMPFIDSLEENTIEGRLHVGVFGGGTCNTEFEALTGNTLAFLSAGAYPYTENVTDPLFSLASFFKNKGYLTEAFHANEPQNWNRNMVYPFMGFDRFNSIQDYVEALGDVPYLHGHPADTADYRFMERVDEENNDKPRFLFNVTMQNHSGYEKWEDVDEAETVSENVPYLYQDSRTYLSLVKASDDAVRQLVETYRNSDEPTMIVFFGDHQPGLPSVAQGEIYTEAKTFLDMYTSKFFIWTNYESESMHDVDVSANFLPYLIMRQGNFMMPPYVQMLGEVYERYPVVSAMGLVDRDGEQYPSVDDVLDDPLIQEYRYVQYANMFDEINDAWFE